MQAMIPGQMKQENPNELIFIAKVINSEDIEDIQKSDKIDHLTEDLSDVKADLNTVISSVQTLKSDLDEIKKLLRKWLPHNLAPGVTNGKYSNFNSIHN